MATSGSFLKGADAQWQEMAEGRRMQMLCYNDQLMMLRWEFAAGAVGEPHTHPHTQTAYIESGLFEVTIDGVTERLGPGSSYVVDGGVLHGAVCIEAGTMVDAFTPHRADYI
ncbi:cupin domain-containing protein [Pelagibacterium halotolerans]|uniref:Pectin degradation protein n=1 Tax=Pelagibacterium halotolerans (strain DSM 22347 / JCM 15775 / CGMCC 1.7692 / B2) TaxID=1082931 RepID=G4RFM1_PELHB|nr:cupin domain-containing protein [Pelagibacterium halotolerans]AEQ53023.1 pectin degradation protein [Pelagibacterium halotolerans B2]QJR17319.1 cupin domain-containing protein [Pelagibacterium halotolerans]SEA86275.1 Cupin domain-containing protein [Pelagibacterium halotolerans]